jgi:hypothetical protein
MAETPNAARTVTQTIETELARAEVVALLANATDIPRWAPDFADSVSGDAGSGWQVAKDGRTFALRVAVNELAGTVDYLRQISPGAEGGAYIRVVPRPTGGSVVIMTLPLLPDVDAADTTATLRQELKALVSLAEKATEP